MTTELRPETRIENTFDQWIQDNKALKSKGLVYSLMLLIYYQTIFE